jgi:UDP-N-acetylglucosamine--N-acetylmuramyl-(pentapeptide) pyrophosphoryl-undecaprenol N-acetylglucosamine transferase|tara:strand:+ start:331 stop:666 length:336 start_codon:yes stop_codon:yes gene_type:complete
MANAYAISDLIICRSGALTLAEITVCGKPAILIPFSHAAGDHQKKNADSLGDAGAATVLLESTLNSNHLYHTIIKLLNNKKKINQMSTFSKKLGLPQATNDIVNYIMEENN